ncbi:cation diffusion facilitator family transporter [Taklimakanibacter lacteus]|uniref:cation diffusion facilitator family transporter n=1 Tax=Taklimakanibacter lacteus TaxID=2268456 RepID=UPI000E65F9BD
MAVSEKQSVALVSMAASAGLAVAKLVAGLLTGSLGILSEAVHSFIDFCATVITFFAVRLGDQPPDERHHYGHAKFESIAALAETGLLLATTGWIAYEAIHRLISGDTQIFLTWWAVAIIVLSIVIDFFRSRALDRIAKATSSEALAADALNFTSDMWSSTAVLLGLAVTWSGFPAADSIAALIVAAVMAVIALRLGKRTLDTLLDAAPGSATEDIRKIVEAAPGVLALERLRIRPAGATLFAGVVVSVPRTMPVDDLIALREKLVRDIRLAYPHADVTVTTDPVALDDETIAQRVRLIAHRQDLAIHHLTIQRVGIRTAVSFDLEVDGKMALLDAHEKATALEAAIRGELGADVEVESHIEPLPERVLPGEDLPEPGKNEIEAILRKLAAGEKRVSDIHNVRIRRNSEGIFVHYHCRFSPDEAVDTVHEIIDHIEVALQRLKPEVRRVIAHAEPIGHALH